MTAQNLILSRRSIIGTSSAKKEAAGEEFIDIEDMYGYRPVSLERAVKCPHCGHEENVDLEDFMYDESSYEKKKWYGTGSCVQH